MIFVITMVKLTIVPMIVYAPKGYATQRLQNLQSVNAMDK
jgi:hypothetical protein